MTSNAESILIVEDDRSTRKILTRHVEKIGFVPTVVEDGEQAIEMFSIRTFDLLLLDLNLPGLSGIEVLKILRRKYPLDSLPIIVVSTAEDNESVINALKFGANDFINKPVESRILSARIQTQLTIKEKVTAYLEIKQNLENLVEQRTQELDELNKQLEKDQKLLDHLLSYNPAITYITNIENNHDCSFISKNVHSILGYPPEQMIGINFWDNFIHPQDKHDAIKNIEQNITSGGGNTEYRFRHLDGSYYWVMDQHLVLEEKNIPIGIIGSLIDISTHKKQIAEISDQKNRDDMTGLINRQNFEKRLENIFSWSDTLQHVLCYIDLDNFKVISIYGQVAGNEMLRQISGILKDVLSKRDIIAYLGSDEFGVILQYCTRSQALRLMKKFSNVLNEYRFNWEDKNHTITASIGMVEIDQHVNPSTILSAANLACDMAKEQGRNQIYINTPTSSSLKHRQQEMMWVERVNLAIEEDRLLLYCQPIVAIDNVSERQHFEILVRMKDEQGVLILPNSFLPAVERYSLSAKFDQWVIQTTTSWLETRPEYQQKNYIWGINLSGQSIADKNLQYFVVEDFERKQISPEHICFEITETAAIANLENAMEFINKLSKKGCRFALDDFGSGLSSFAYLKNLPVNYIKIDGMFIRDSASNEVDFAMVKAINDVSQSMGMRTIAEYVESDEIIKRLITIGVNYVQGYAISKPVPLHEFCPE